VADSKISVLVVDPVRKRVYERLLGPSRGAVHTVVGAKTESWYGVWPKHALAVAERQQPKQPGWRLEVESCAEEVFHGPGVLYGVQAAGRASHGLSLAAVTSSIKWIDQNEESS
jgi:hypothetical protein